MKTHGDTVTLEKFPRSLALGLSPELARATGKFPLAERSRQVIVEP